MTTPRLKVIRVKEHEDHIRETSFFRIIWDGDLVGNVFVLNHEAENFITKVREIEEMIREGYMFVMEKERNNGN